jgi:RNA polymerase sigma factor (sigma-70 family)
MGFSHSARHERACSLPHLAVSWLPFTEALMDESSFDLVMRAKAGDDHALDRLLRRYFPRLRRWVRADLPVWAQEFNDTEDLVQETLVNACRNLPNLQMHSRFSFRSYMRRAARNRVHDEVKRATRRPRVERLSDWACSEEPSTLAKCISREDLWRCRAAFARLGAEDRKIILLRLSDPEASFRALASRAGKPSEDAARVALGRAITRLAREMHRID